MKKFFIAWSALLLLIAGCKKDKNDGSSDVPAATVSNISGNYKIDSILIRYNGVTYNYMDSLLDKCAQDDILNFKSDGTFTWTDAGVSCSPSSAYSSTWSLPSTSKMLFDSSLYDIDKFDGKSLDISQSESVNGQIASYVIKLKKQ